MTGRARPVRVVALAMLVGVAIAIGGAPAPAEAHTVTGVKPTNYRSDILSVRPALPGVTLRLLDLGRRIQLTNTSRRDVVVIGYFKEPYLRVGPAGVFENTRSPTVDLNKTTPSGVTTTTSTTAGAAANASAGQPPAWHRISASTRARWPDRRTRFEGAPPPEVAAAPGQRHVVVSAWEIDLQAGASTARVVGRITYIPGPNPWPWVGATVAVFALVLAAAWSARWGMWLSAGLALLLASDAMQSFGTAAATHDSFAAQLVRVLLGGLVTTLAWIVGVIAIPALQRNHEGGLITAGAVGLVIAMFSGVTDAGLLGRSQVATAFPAVTARVAVVIALGVGLGLVAAAIAVIARDPRLRPRMD